LAAAFTIASFSSAWAVDYTATNGFEFDTGGWTSATRVASGTDGISSAAGGFHAKLAAGSFTRWGGYKSVFPAGGFTTSVRFYLNPAGGWANDTRFSFTSAVSNVSGAHLRDFGFNAGFYNDAVGPGAGTNRILVNVSNGVGRGNSNPKDANVIISSAGWYTFEHSFQDNGSGVLAVTLTVRDSSNAVVGTPTTLSTPADVIGTVVGGNRYGWLQTNEFTGGLPSDGGSITSSAFPSIANITQGTYHLAISSAVGEATPADVIGLGAGTYTEGSLTLNKALTLQGPNAGVAGSATRAAEARISDSAWTVTAAGVVIDGLEIFQTNNSASPVSIQASNVTVSHSVIKREGVDAGQFVRGIEISPGLAGYSIQGNLITGSTSGGLFSGHKTWNSGMYVNGGSGTISGNTFENCRGVLNLDDFNAGISITGNSFRNSGTYISFGGVSPTTGSFAISGNDFDFNLAIPALPSAFLNNSNVAPTFRIDATGNTFGGTATAALSDANKFAIEARMVHRGRGSKNGVIDYSAGEQVVVSGTTIASAIDAASASHTVLVGPGTFTEDVALTKSLTLQGTGPGSTTLVGPIGGASITVQIAASNAKVDGFTITRAGNNVTDWNNPSLNNSGLAIQGLGFTGTTISNNEITGMRTAIDINNSNGHTVRNNVIHNNHTGLIFRNQTDNLTLVENAITGNRTVGILFLDGSGGTNTPAQSAAGCTFSNNNLSGNWYGQVVDRQTGGALPAPGANLKNFEGNWFGTDTPVVVAANSSEPAYSSLIPVAFGGAATAPGGQPDIAGPASANIDYSPRLSLGTDTDVETTPGRGTYGFQGNASSLWDGSTPAIEINSPVVYPNYFIPTGTTVTVTSIGSLQVGELEVAPGATLIVEGGELVIGDGSKISGNFTIFNSFGSWDINGDTTFEIGQSLALITDIHVAAAATLTVNGGGELLLDGCVIDSQTPGSPYFIEVEDNGLLTLVRSVVSDARINIDTLSSSVPANFRSRVFDNRFTASDIEASADSKVYHNLFDAPTDSAANTDLSAAFTAVDGWSNVTSEAALQNTFSLEFAAPVNPTRTLDAGNLFVQSADPVVLDMKVASLGANTIIAAEALLGYNSNLLTLVTPTPAVSPESGWSVIVDDDSIDGALGLVDSAVGLDLLPPPGNDGISADTTIAKVNFTADAPGITVGFFRAQTSGEFNPDGSFLKDTRLTKSALGVPSFLSSFTANSGELVIDDQDPTIATPAVSGTQVQPSVLTLVDVLAPASRVLRNGTPVILTFTATDTGLAGLDALDASDDLVLTADNGVTVLNSSNYSVSAIESMGVVTYTVVLTVPVTATTGTYAVEATVLDRSGNPSAEALLGSFVIANEAIATVELQSFTATTRDVTFVATNGGGSVLATWTKTITNFSGGIGSVALENVPAGTAAISAKTAWTLRSKVPASFSLEGVGAVSLTGGDLLKAGDLTGDNVVNTLDYSVLRFNWLTSNAVADITGNGVVNTGDYNPLQANFYTVGDPQ
jgi:nitrous oxidase accessory protein NosD